MIHVFIQSSVTQMTSLRDFWLEVLRLPYKPNSQKDPQHELQFKSLLDKWGLSYEYQPNGPQQSPDFRICFPSGTVLDVECKSSQQPFPTYNCGLPKEKTVYVFSSRKYNETTVYFGEDVVSCGKRELYYSLTEDLKKVLKGYQCRVDWVDDRGFDFYVRPMYTQSGGKTKTDYFTHDKRSFCETRVLGSSW